MITQSKFSNRVWLRVLCLCMALCMLVGMLPATAIAADTITVYFENNWNWSNVKIYYWGSKTSTNPSWPGKTMTKSGNNGSYDYYVWEVPADVTGIIFNNGSGTQSIDITSGWYDGICYYMEWKNNKNQVGTFKICQNFPDKHTTVKVAGYAATCTKAGLTDGTKCTLCNQTVTAQKTIAAKGHRFEGDTCTVCGVGYTTVYFRNDWFWSDVKLYYWYGDNNAVNNIWPGEAMTYYNNDGEFDYYVGKVPADIKGMQINGLKNDAPNTRDQSPDITSDRYDGIVYYMFYVEGKGNQVRSFDISEAKFPCKHLKQEDVTGYDATCTEDGLTDGIKCSDCGETLKAQEDIEAKGHDYKAVVTEPDCENGGYTTYTCSVCDDTYTADETEAKGHTEEVIPGYAADCTNPGLTDGIKCSVCGETIKAQEEIPAKGHTEEIIPGYEATCTDEGLTDGAYCIYCGETLKEQEVISAKGHEEPVCTNNGANHWAEYPCCDDYDDYEEHSFADGKCVCGAPETISVAVYNEYGTADAVVLSNSAATPGQDYVTTVTATVGTSLRIGGVYVAIEDCIYGGDSVFKFDAETGTLTVYGDYVAEGMQIEVVPIVTLTGHLNGGSVNGDYWQYVLEPDENGMFTYEYVYGEEWPIFTAYEACFVREGYKLVGYNTAADGTGIDYALDEVYSWSQDLELYLIWECDHSWTDATCTAPKTCDRCGATQGETLDHADTNKDGRCDVCNELMAEAQLMKVSVSLKGNIAVNYYMLLSDAVLADSTAYMQFTLADGEIRKVSVSEGVKMVLDGETYYVYTCAVSAKEMTDNILSQFFYAGGETRLHTYNVQTYAKHIIADYDDEATKNLMAAMLNYGTASQVHFGYNTDALANSIQDDNGNDLIAAPDYSSVTIEGFNAVAGQGTELAKFYSASLILKSETTVRFFFQVDSGATLTAAYQGQELVVNQRGSLYYVDVVGISAKDLDEDVTITIHDGTNTKDISFNPMSYCQGVLNDTTGSFTAEMKDLVCALYLYNQAANVYFKEV